MNENQILNESKGHFSLMRQAWAAIDNNPFFLF